MLVYFSLINLIKYFSVIIFKYFSNSFAFKREEERIRMKEKKKDRGLLKT
jgi:hypothetical protein